MADQGTYTATNLPVDGTTIDASDVNTDLQGLIDEFNKQVGYSKMNINGNITNSDIIVSAGINLSKLESVAWTSWTPTWVASSGGNSIGNGSLTGVYQKIGRTVHFRVDLTFGSTTNKGTGTYTWATPFAVAGPPADSSCGTARITNNGTTIMGYAVINGTNTFQCNFFSANVTTNNFIQGNATGSPNIIGAWASGDSIRFEGTFEAAT